MLARTRKEVTIEVRELVTQVEHSYPKEIYHIFENRRGWGLEI